MISGHRVFFKVSESLLVMFHFGRIWGGSPQKQGGWRGVGASREELVFQIIFFEIAKTFSKWGSIEKRGQRCGFGLL